MSGALGKDPVTASFKFLRVPLKIMTLKLTKILYLATMEAWEDSSVRAKGGGVYLSLSPQKQSKTKWKNWAEPVTSVIPALGEVEAGGCLRLDGQPV